MRRATMAAVSAFLVTGLACGPMGGGGGGTADTLTSQEIRAVESQYGDMYSVIQSERPQWLRSRGTMSVENPDAGYPVVFVNGMRRGGLESLRSINPSDVAEAEFLNARDATTRYGTGYPGGIIRISTRSGQSGCLTSPVPIGPHDRQRRPAPPCGTGVEDVPYVPVLERVDDAQARALLLQEVVHVRLRQAAAVQLLLHLAGGPGVAGVARARHRFVAVHHQRGPPSVGLAPAHLAPEHLPGHGGIELPAVDLVRVHGRPFPVPVPPSPERTARRAARHTDSGADSVRAV